MLSLQIAYRRNIISGRESEDSDAAEVVGLVGGAVVDPGLQGGEAPGEGGGTGGNTEKTKEVSKVY